MYKDILLCISEEQGRENLISDAAEFAKQHNARLSGMFLSVHQDSMLPAFGLIAVERALHVAEQARIVCAEAHERFLSITKQKQVEAVWLEIEGETPALSAARYTDLIMTSQVQSDPVTGDSSAGMINSLLLESAKPLLLLPADWQTGVLAKRVVVGWDESREAMRAVHDALPLLQAAENVYVLTVTPAAEKQPGTSPLIDYLSARGVTCEFHAISKEHDRQKSAQLLLTAGDAHKADLYVLGGYGHSRFREVVLGGVTRHMIQHSNTPVFLSH